MSLIQPFRCQGVDDRSAWDWPHQEPTQVKSRVNGYEALYSPEFLVQSELMLASLESSVKSPILPNLSPFESHK